MSFETANIIKIDSNTWNNLKLDEKINLVIENISNITLFSPKIREIDLENFERYVYYINNLFEEIIRNIYKIAYKYEKDTSLHLKDYYIKDYFKLLVDINFILNKINMIIFYNKNNYYSAYLLEDTVKILALELKNIKNFKLYKDELNQETWKVYQKIAKNINLFFKNLEKLKNFDNQNLYKDNKTEISFLKFIKKLFNKNKKD